MSYPRIREIDPGVKSYDEAFETFRREAPQFYNIAEDTRDRHAEHPV